MNNKSKPKLLFLRFTQPNIPSFLQRHLQEHVRCLSQQFDVTVVTDESCDYKQLCERHEPDIAMFESGSYVGKRKVTNVTACPSVPKVGFLSCDAYCPTRKKAIADMARWEISAFFGNSVSLPSYTPSIADNFFAWPNFVIPELHRDYNFPKVIPILFTGSQAPNYPWRNRIDRIVSQRYPALHSPHFGFQWQKGKPSAWSFLEGEKYAQLINSAWIAPTCGTISNEVVRKHFEIPACNTCLLTQKTAALEAAGFVDLVNCVFADDGDVLDKLEWLFANPEELQAIITAGKKLVDSRHTIQQRNQVFEWYTLHKKLKPGQRIVQPGTFLPLTIVDENSGIKNVHAESNGVDRLLLKQGDERLRPGKYAEAEQLYRQCLNYQQPDIPEARFRLILCLLHQGEAKAALASLREQFPSHRLVNEKDIEPDPTEWAWFIIALLCRGKHREATLRAEQFPSLHNEELGRARQVLQTLHGETTRSESNLRRVALRASVHQPLDIDFEAWLNCLQRMLEACGQIETARRLARVHSSSPSPAAMKSTPEVLEARPRSVKHSILKYSFAAGSRLSRFADRFTHRKLPRHSTIIRDERATIAHWMQKEEIRTGVLIGAAAGSWLTDVFIQGMRNKSSRPAAVLAAGDTAEFRALRAKFDDDEKLTFRCVTGQGDSIVGSSDDPDIVAVNCNAAAPATENLATGAALVVLAHLHTPAGNHHLRAMLSNGNYVLVALEHVRFDGYAVFRRIAPQRPILNSPQVGSVDYPISLSA